METIKENTVVPYEKTAVVLGNFDGLHIAHTAIIKRGIEYAAAHNIKSGALMFFENTKSVTEKHGVRLITGNTEKLRLLADMGLDFVYTHKFDREFMRKSPETFISELVKFLKPAAVFVGYDYRFGCKAEGDVSLLKRLGEKYGFEAVIIPEIKSDGKSVSSTLIRSLIEKGDIRTANKFLGRSFTMCGNVGYGLQNGRKMGFPTANLVYDERMVIPCGGVYAGFTFVDGKMYKSVINVGSNPTFNADKITIESYIFNFDRDIYESDICISFVDKIRGDIKFRGMDELKAQIAADVCRAEEILNSEEGNDRNGRYCLDK